MCVSVRAYERVSIGVNGHRREFVSSPARGSAVSSCVKFVLSLLVPNPMRLTQRADTKTLALLGSATEANIACVMVSNSSLALELGFGCQFSPV